MRHAATHALLPAAVLLALVAFDAAALGATPPGHPAPGEHPLEPDAAPPARRGALEHRALYVPEATLPGPGRLVLAYDVGLSTARGPTRPLAGVDGEAAVVHGVSVELGAHERLAPVAAGWLVPSSESDSGARGAFRGGLRVAVASGGGFALSLEPAAALGFDVVGSLGVRAGSRLDVGAVRVAAAVDVERALAAGRDAADVHAAAAVSYRVGRLRLGLEYVGQDLEDLVEPDEAEGGMVHAVGPSLALELARRAVVTLGPALGLDARGTHLLGRLGVALGF